jgi:hypothetical protein
VGHGAEFQVTSVMFVSEVLEGYHCRRPALCITLVLFHSAFSSGGNEHHFTGEDMESLRI